MTGPDLLAFELRGWRRHPPVLLGLATFGAALGLSFWIGAYAVIGAAALVAMAGPYTLFWRDDAAVLSRLPVSGTSLHDLGFVGIVRFALVLLAGVLPGAWQHGVLVPALTSIAAATLSAPAAAIAAGAILASDRARAAVKEVGQGFEPPPTAFLSMFPALLAAGLGFGTYVELTGEPRLGPILVAGAAVLFIVGRTAAGKTLPDALRELTALQAVRLAHVDLSTARGLERAVGSLAGAARPIYEKDVALTRRRYPLFSLGHGAALACFGAYALGASPRVFVCGLALVVVSVALLAASLRRPPTEQPRLLEALYAPGPVARAKHLYTAWRAIWPLAIAAVIWLGKALWHG
jgi:hypothetical protein